MQIQIWAAITACLNLQWPVKCLTLWFTCIIYAQIFISYFFNRLNYIRGEGRGGGKQNKHYQPCCTYFQKTELVFTDPSNIYMSTCFFFPIVRDTKQQNGFLNLTTQLLPRISLSSVNDSDNWFSHFLYDPSLKNKNVINFVFVTSIAELKISTSKRNSPFHCSKILLILVHL